MWQLLLCILSRPVIRVVSLVTARAAVMTWRENVFPKHSSMYHDLRSTEERLASMTNSTGIVGLVDPHGTVCAIATFEAPSHISLRQVVVCDVACGDYTSGSVLVRTITRTPGVGCGANLPDRWRIAHAYSLTHPSASGS